MAGMTVAMFCQICCLC